MYTQCLDAERYDKSKTNLEGNVLGTGINTCVDTGPRTSLSVGLVYVYTKAVLFIYKLQSSLFSFAGVLVEF